MLVSASAATTLRGVIDQSLAPAPAAAGAAPSDFCSLWPEAKPILQALVALVSAIPGVGKSAGPILASLITVGDAVHQQTCPAATGAAPVSAQADARMAIEQSLAVSGTAGVGAGAISFCSVWPEAKPILQLASGIVSFIPGVGAAAGPILISLIAVGDSVFQETCHN